MTCVEPRALAERAGIEALLRCWVRELGIAEPGDGVLRLHLSGGEVEADVTYWSPSGWHRFGAVRRNMGEPVDAVTLAVLLTSAAARRVPEVPPGDDRDQAGPGDPSGPSDPSEPSDPSGTAGRVADSVHRVATHIAVRTRAVGDPVESTPFLAAERALLLGHPLHPAPKSRAGLSDDEAGLYSPELRGGFALHWFAADRSICSTDSAWAEPAECIVSRLAGGSVQPPPGTVLLPAHPWQAREVRDRPEVRALLEAGLLRDLGPAGPDWYPTSSLRTVYRPDAPVMLKLSLGLSITNSKRENLRKELYRGAEVHRLLDAGLGERLATAHPGFRIVRDPAWLALDMPGGSDSGLEVAIRENPFGPDDRVACVAGLVAERPDLGRSGLAARVEELALRFDRPVPDVAEEWFARYLRAVITPVFWLYGAYGIGLEAHQQNTLVVLDGDGWPVGGWYRDNQGYYLSAGRVEGLERFLPGVGKRGDSRVDAEVIDERIGYYVGINNVLGLIGAFGSQRLAAERRLLAHYREVLRDLHAEHGENLRLAATLAYRPTVRSKANLLTRVAGLDELVGPLETQSVYRDIPNPVALSGVESA